MDLGGAVIDLEQAPMRAGFQEARLHSPRGRIAGIRVDKDAPF